MFWWPALIAMAVARKFSGDRTKFWHMKSLWCWECHYVTTTNMEVWKHWHARWMEFSWWCTIYKAILQWDKKSGSGWHDDYGANAQTPGEKQVFKEFLKMPEIWYDKPGCKKHFTNNLNSMLHSRPMQWKCGHIIKECKLLCLVPSQQGTHAFYPGSSSSQLAMKILNVVDADGGWS